LIVYFVLKSNLKRDETEFTNFSLGISYYIQQRQQFFLIKL